MSTTSLLMAYIGAVNLLIEKHNRLANEGRANAEDCEIMARVCADFNKHVTTKEARCTNKTQKFGIFDRAVAWGE